MTRRLLLAVAVVAAVIAAALWATAGFAVTVRGLRLSARSPLPMIVLSGATLAAWAFRARRQDGVSADLIGAEAWLHRRARALVLVIAGLAAAVSVNYQTFSAAGADASGYFSQAAMLASGRLSREEPLGAIAGWPGGAATLVPLGWRAAADPSTQVPTYAIGLPLLMAPLHALGGSVLASLIGPASLALAVWAVARMAHAVSGPAAAIVSAAWLATSPVSLISAMQPMSDGPATAAWLLCLALVVSIAAAREPVERRALAAGCLAAVAVLIRPNLAPVAAIPALMLLTSRGRRPAAWCAGPIAVAAAIVAVVQWRWFGSPLRSGYGTAEEIYALANVAANAGLYGKWLFDTHGPWLFAAPLAAIVLPNRGLRGLLVFAAAIVAAYLVYAVFETWTYLRFLLPALAIAMVATAALVEQVLARVPAAARVLAVVAIVVAIAALQIRSARSHEVFTLADRHARASLAGRYLAAAMPARSVIVAGEQSGALRYYTGRSILRWEVLTPDALTAATTRLGTAGYEVWLAFDEWEEDLVRRKFAGSDAGALDWPPLLEAGTVMRTRAWRLRDREPFMRDGTSHTDFLR